MSPQGDLIYSTRDSYGELRVFDDGIQRLLSFGPEDEQSACLKSDPARLVFEYMQAMSLVLNWYEPKKALLLGLGAGALCHTLQRHHKGVKIQVVELREAVIEAAYNYFYLPRSKRLQVYCQDALNFVHHNQERFDLVMSDLFTEQGVLRKQFTPGNLRAFKRALKPEGCLVINCWKQHIFESSWLQLLKALFPYLYSCTTRDGNWILFASERALDAKREEIIHLEKKLGFALMPAFKHFQLVE